jgi:protein transport protein SEC24
LIGGKTMLFSSGMYSGGLGALICRDDPELYNYDGEKGLISPGNNIFVKMAQECVQSRICVDIFYAANSAKSIDLGSISPLVSLTGGDLHFFNSFNIAKHGEKLHYEIYRGLTRTVGRDVIIKA